MPRVHPFTALRYLGDAESRFTWTTGLNGPGEPAVPPPLHSRTLLTDPDPAALLRRWAGEGALLSETPALYVVETSPVQPRPGRTDAPARFLVGALEPDAAPAPLEAEAPEVGANPAQCVPVLAADDQHALEETLAAVAQPPPRASWVADGHRVRLWKTDDRAVARRLDDVLSEMILRPLWRLPRGARSLVAVAPVSSAAVDLRPVHRGLAHLPTFQPERFLAVVKDYARVYELDAPLVTPEGMDSARARMAALATRSHAVLLVLPDGQGRILRFRQDLDLAHLRAAPRSPTLRSLDLALLEAVVLQTVLGIKDPQAKAHPHVFPVATVPALVQRVNAGVFQAGFALNPPPRWELRAVMEAAQDLPPRTLYVDGAPPAGLLFLAP